MEYKDLFEYNESSPSCLTWKIDRYSGRGYKRQVAWAGSQAGSVDVHGYYTVPFNRKNIRCHLIVARLNGLFVSDGFEIDHEDQNRKNNKIGNLRVVSRTRNMRNKTKYQSNTSGVTGVYEYTTIQKNIARTYFVAQWVGLDGKRDVKRFSIAKHGTDIAFKLACEYRASMILALNASGAGYTETHGIT